MRPFVPTELESHLITQHDVTPELIAQTRETLGPRADGVSETSHALLHTMRECDHTHKDKDDIA